MAESILARFFEHNNWANEQIIKACSALSDEQLDAEPKSATEGSIRHTLLHLVTSQQGYLSLLTQPLEERRRVTPRFSELQQSASLSGEGLLALARDKAVNTPKTPRRTKDDFLVKPWVVMVQAINHATEHREQIKSMLTALGVHPPDIDGWDYGGVANALLPVSKG